MRTAAELAVPAWSRRRDYESSHLERALFKEFNLNYQYQLVDEGLVYPVMLLYLLRLSNKIYELLAKENPRHLCVSSICERDRMFDNSPRCQLLGSWIAEGYEIPLKVTLNCTETAVAQIQQ